MDIFYYKHKKGNFGDELNPFLWNSIFGEDRLKQHTDSILFGIGTILEKGVLSDYSNKEVHVFGSGVRNLWDTIPKDNINFHFVRGPITANVMGLDSSYAITDAAYCLRFVDGLRFKTEKKYKFSFMPHFSSMHLIDWQSVCDSLDIHFISPLGDIHFIMDEINATEYMLAEAMHGAIVADYLRVPWVRIVGKAHFFESRIISELKWEDWSRSVGCKNIWNFEAKNFHTEGQGIKGKILNTVNTMFLKKMFAKIIANKDSYFQLSEDQKLNEIFDQLNDKVEGFKKHL